MFLKIGDLYINQDHIVDIWKGEGAVHIVTDLMEEDEVRWYRFEGEEREAILNWLEYRAEVSVVY